MLGFLRDRRRARLLATPFPEEWRPYLHRFNWYRSLDAARRRRLEDLVRIFINEKQFEGCAGLVLTDEMKVVIAAQACLLLVGRVGADSDELYPGLSTILVYPAAYRAVTKTIGPGGVVTESDGVRLGESWNSTNGPGSGGPIVLSWSDVVAGSANEHDGRNVVLHEFAHQLDAEAGGMDGAPKLHGRSAYNAWARVFSGEFARLAHDLAAAHPHLINAYGATNPPEFFAVVTEHFFEQPALLREQHPDLYAQLASFYGQAPGGT